MPMMSVGKDWRVSKYKKGGLIIKGKYEKKK